MDLNPLFKPKKMVVIGVSLTNESHPANVIYNKNQLRHKAEVFGVNSKGGIIRGETIYQKVSDIQEKIDLAVIVTRAEFCPSILTECIEAGVKSAIIVSGGFAETGEKALQDRLVAIAREADFPFIGPNCIGIFVPPYGDTFFIPSERIVKPEKGNVAIISQSGGVLIDYMVKFAIEGVGLSTAVSIGNKAYIGEIELLRYFKDDPETSVIAFYIEGFNENEGRDFVMAASECPKPVIVIKSGKTPGGKKAVSSHTASMAGNYEVFSSVMSQYGIVEAKDDYEFIASAEALSYYQQHIEGKIGIVTGTGGHGAMAVDICLLHGLDVPVMDEQFKDELKKKLTPTIQQIASLTNPIDLTGSAIDEDFIVATRQLSKNSQVDCILALLLPYVPGMSFDLGAKLGLVYQQEGKPIIAYVPHVERFEVLIEGLKCNSIPVSHSIEDAIHMAEAIKRYKKC